MWARIVECMLAVWLAMSPFIFGRGDVAPMRWLVELGAASIVVTASLASYWHKTPRAHLVTLFAGLLLAGHGYLAGGHSPPPAMQNHLVVGLLLFMMAIIPSHNEQPPRKWQRFYAEARDR